VLQWWIKLQEGLINRGEDPCRTWKGMKLVLQRQFDPPIEHPIPKINKIAMTFGKHSFGTKSNVHSLWSESIIGDVLPTHSYGNKTVATHSQRCHGSEQKLKPSLCGIVQNKKSLNAEKKSLRRIHMLFIVKITSLGKKTRILILLLLLTFHIIIVVRVLIFLADMWRK
jgi:hypothetical protein